MFKVFILNFLLCILVTRASHAQDIAYLPPEALAVTYLEAVPKIVSQIDAIEERNNLIQAIHDEVIFKQYLQAKVPFEVVYSAYDAIDTVPWYFDKPPWNQAVILAWLRENKVDLSAVSRIEFYDYTIDIDTRDFDVDGEDEWILDARRMTKTQWGSTTDFHQWLVVNMINDDYHIVESPLDWFDDASMYWSVRSGFMEELAFKDLNGNGIPEWILAVGGYGGGHQNHGFIRILEWQDESLVDLAPPFENRWSAGSMSYSNSAGGGAPLFPWGVYVSVDDIQHPVTIIQDFHDNWGCLSTDVRHFDWNDTTRTYQLAEQLRRFSDTGDCALRQAQEEMWEGNYAQSIPLFEHALDLYIETNSREEANSRYAYASIRLALAYALMERSEQAAQQLLTTTQLDYDEPIAELVMAASEAYMLNQNSLDLCIAMYDTFAEYFSRDGFYANTYWGTTWDIVVPLFAPGSTGPNANPATAGCDAPSLLRSRLDNSIFNVEQSFIPQLTNQDLRSQKVFALDFNRDNIDDWIIWFGDRLPTYVLLSDEDHYKVLEFEWYELPFHKSIMDTYQWQLPDGTPAVLFLGYDTRSNDERSAEITGGPVPYCQIEGNDNEYPRGEVHLRWLEDNDLKWWSALYCQPLTLEEIFPEGFGSSEIHVWISNYDENSVDFMRLLPAIYVWDDEALHYTLSPQAQVTSQSIDESSSVVDTATSPQLVSLYTVSESFRRGDYAEAVTNAQTRMAQLGADDVTIDLYETQYYLALALEALGQTTNAVTEYLAIYDAVPNSAWGLLAAIHFRLIND